MSTRDFDIELQLLLDAIYLKYHYDFRSYAHASLKRRLKSAMIQLGCHTLSQVQDRIVHDPSAFSALLGFLTVPVTEMFRDPLYFLALRQQVVPVLRTYPSLKIWVAGCSTGEEAYSLAILLREEQLLERTIIYASLSDYYTAGYGRAVFDKSLRKNIVFSDHSLATDSVFAEVQLVSCRNVLIYFNRDLQDRALGLFREALCRKGFLGLGAKESLRFSKYANTFLEIAPGDRIYQKDDAA